MSMPLSGTEIRTWLPKPFIMGASAYVFANDAPALVKFFANIARRVGFNVWVCDGVNDQVEIQAAIDALPWYGGWVQLSEGHFYVSKQAGKTCAINLAVDTVTGLCNITLHGAGLNATNIILANNQDCNIIEMKTGAYNTGWKTVGDMTLDGNKANQASGHGIYFKKVGAGIEFDSKFYNVFASHCKEDGFHIENGWGVTINSCLAEFCDGIGLYLAGDQCYVNGFYSSGHLKSGMYFIVSGLQLSNFRIDGVDEDGIYDASSDSEISNGSISDWGATATWTYRAIELAGHNVRVSNITIKGDGSSNTCYGIESRGYNTIIGCGIELCREGISIKGDNNVVANNLIRDCATDGILIANDTDSVISGNRITTCGTSIDLNIASAIRCLIFGNNWQGCTNNPSYAAAITPRFTDNLDIAGNPWLVDDYEVIKIVWVKHDVANPAICTVPAGSWVSVDVFVSELFNAATTNLLTIGYDADPDSVATFADPAIHTTGRKTTTYGVEGGYMPTSRAIEAYYTYTGGAPATGEALIVFKVTRAAVR